MKCGIRHDLIFREPAPSSALETQSQDDDDDELAGGDVTKPEGDEESWDAILDDEEDVIDLDGEDEEDFDVDMHSGSDVEC